MQFDTRPRLGYHGVRSRAQSWIVKTLAVAGTGIMLLSAIIISFVLFSLALAGLLLFGAYLWWKTRDRRQQVNSPMQHSRFEDGEVIEGVIIRETSIREPHSD